MSDQGNVEHVKVEGIRDETKTVVRISEKALLRILNRLTPAEQQILEILARCKLMTKKQLGFATSNAKCERDKVRIAARNLARLINNGLVIVEKMRRPSSRNEHLVYHLTYAGCRALVMMGMDTSTRQLYKSIERVKGNSWILDHHVQTIDTAMSFIKAGFKMLEWAADGEYALEFRTLGNRYKIVPDGHAEMIFKGKYYEALIETSRTAQKLPQKARKYGALISDNDI